MYECGNCEKRWAEPDLEVVFPNIPDLLERLDVGGTVPAGECPDCGALVYREEDRTPLRVPDVVLKALRHAMERLNQIPHRYADTDFRLIDSGIAAAEKGGEPVRLLVVLEGGLVQEFLADGPGVEAAVIDMDIEGADEEFDEIVDVTGDGYALRGTLQAHDVAIAPEAIVSAWRPAEPEPQHAQ